ncbi:hypothetical protein PR048_006173 [Dryococelus australis]|uniref:Uncharacterized protein n=1 Tax=Dryococelus australis TaxID=614101 RepID=A0ABQ9ICF0_9NEOP|nr:hypothetical protein PR048_006173 [Dryococelus australis]
MNTGVAVSPEAQVRVLTELPRSDLRCWWESGTWKSAERDDSRCMSHLTLCKIVKRVNPPILVYHVVHLSTFCLSLVGTRFQHLRAKFSSASSGDGAAVAEWSDCSPSTKANLGIVPHDAACGLVFSGISRFLRTCIPSLLHSQLISPSSAFIASLLRAAQISQLNSRELRVGEQGRFNKPAASAVCIFASHEGLSARPRVGITPLPLAKGVAVPGPLWFPPTVCRALRQCRGFLYMNSNARPHQVVLVDGYLEMRDLPIQIGRLADSEVSRDGASCSEKRDWGRNGMESVIAFVKGPSQNSSGVISGNR